MIKVTWENKELINLKKEKKNNTFIKDQMTKKTMPLLLLRINFKKGSTKMLVKTIYSGCINKKFSRNMSTSNCHRNVKRTLLNFIEFSVRERLIMTMKISEIRF